MITPLSRNEAKRISELKRAKRRRSENCFVAESWKLIKELLPHFELQLLLVEKSSHLLTDTILSMDGVLAKLREVSPLEMKKCSSLLSPRSCLAVFNIPEEMVLSEDKLLGPLIVALDTVQDPGNVGTILRLCEWMGVKNIILGEGCADPYSPKVVQASMGAIAGVQIFRDVSLPKFFSSLSPNIKLLGADLDGCNLYQYELNLTGQTIVVLGNEGNGISDSVKSLIQENVCIPKSPESKCTESLNVGVAAAIILSQLLKG